MVLDGRYRLVERVGSGGLGDVWRCVDQAADRTVAAKLLSVRAPDDPGLGERIHLAWTRVMTKLDHPGVVHVYGSGVDPEAGAYVIMEWVQSESLQRILAREERLDPTRTMDVVAQVADALGAVHGWGIVHRDLKPGKILVRPDATVVLSAFGLEYPVARPDVITLGLRRSGYGSPEEYMGQQPTPLSDIFSVGVIAYHCLAGQRPFDRPDPLEVAMRVVRDDPPPLPPEVPSRIRSIVERTMAKDPAARWPNASALAAAARATA